MNDVGTPAILRLGAIGGFSSSTVVNFIIAAAADPSPRLKARFLDGQDNWVFSCMHFQDNDLKCQYEVGSARKIRVVRAGNEGPFHAYPDSFNVYDSLAEAYMKNKQNDLAIENFKKSLQLNPKNENALKMLEKLAVH